MVRLNRFLAEAGLGSRRKVESLITEGKISVNGKVCQDLATQVDPDKDEVIFEGKPVAPRLEFYYLVLNKPTGVVVTRSDEQGRATVYSLLPNFARNAVYAGRLDKNSEGLLLFTNDGDMVNRLTHPTFHVEKVYKAEVSGKLNKFQLDQLRGGVEIEGGKTRPAGIFVNAQTDSSTTLKIVITEGKKRQIRLMVEAVGSKVRHLKRLQFGPLKLKDLPTGSWRMLTPGEIKALKVSIDKGFKRQ
ncbi:MAG TPA: pseudouridine synthase [Candidatus Cloacimonadota bacterium]|nr:pseudouridine synthase [Candidatus Cloacimonadota bacterium]